MDEPMTAVIYRGVMDDIEVEVTPEDAARGWVAFECPACQGTGVFAATPEYEQPCVECSTSGQRHASV